MFSLIQWSESLSLLRTSTCANPRHLSLYKLFNFASEVASGDSEEKERNRGIEGIGYRGQISQILLVVLPNHSTTAVYKRCRDHHNVGQTKKSVRCRDEDEQLGYLALALQRRCLVCSVFNNKFRFAADTPHMADRNCIDQSLNQPNHYKQDTFHAKYDEHVECICGRHCTIT